MPSPLHLTDVYPRIGGEWHHVGAFEISVSVLIGDDSLPHIYVRDEFRMGYRTFYSSLDGPRERVPFPDSP